MSNRLQQLKGYGQNIWLDFLSRELLDSGRLEQMIVDGVTGVTSNPAIFKEAITENNTYDADIQTLFDQGQDAEEIYHTLIIADVQRAADILRPTFDEHNGNDGFVSLEVSPTLAFDTDGTIEEAKTLWERVDRPNLFIKVPGTEAGLPAIETLIREGINVNVTLLFSLSRYQAVADAYLKGLYRRVEAGEPVGHIRSVASFFLSRIDTLVDKKLETIIAANDSRQSLARSLRGRVAIASARQAYQMFKQIYAGDLFQGLARHGAQPQKLLWASTSTKDPTYSDVRYIEALIGPNTITTTPEKTLRAYLDHGESAARIEDDLAESYHTLSQLEEIGVSLDEVTAQLETEAVDKFNKPYQALLEAIERQHEQETASVA